MIRVLALLLLPIAAQAQDVVNIRSGIACPPDEIGLSPAPGTIDGFIRNIDEDVVFLSGSHVVPAADGVAFGLTYELTGDVELVGTQVVITHPPMGEDKITKQVIFSSPSSARTAVSIYEFDYDYEKVLGEWTFTAIYRGKTLYREVFTVVPPHMVPELATECNFQDLLG